jgi:hypothetical protein
MSEGVMEHRAQAMVWFPEIWTFSWQPGPPWPQARAPDGQKIYENTEIHTIACLVLCCLHVCCADDSRHDNNALMMTVMFV